jgi:hypothetical protein
MTTIHLSVTQTLNYAVNRAALKDDARGLARKAGRRFAQIVGSDGRILDVLEVV